jgi:tetratricopeptide (TPR) repeat protein
MRYPSIRSPREGAAGRLGAAVAISLLMAIAPAAAAPESENVRQAREHYRLGEEAYAAGRYEDAYREFERGYALAARPVFLLNMAHSERRRGNLSNARALYLKFLLVDPQSKYAPEVQQVVQEIDGALAAEAASLVPAGPVVEQTAVAAPPPSSSVIFSERTPVVAAPLPPPPLYRRWWVWTAVGAVVVTGVATALLLGRASYQKEGSLGTLGTR